MGGLLKSRTKINGGCWGKMKMNKLDGESEKDRKCVVHSPCVRERCIRVLLRPESEKSGTGGRNIGMATER